MRILLAAKHAPHGKRPIGGVQSWCRTVAQELNNRGHAAVTWGPEQTIPLGGFDLGIVANVKDTTRALELCRKNIMVCHGIISAEKPRLGTIHKVVYTSEEVRLYWGGSGPVIRQPIDIDFWSPAHKGNLQQWLTRFSYRGGLQFIQPLAEYLGLQYQHLRNAQPKKVRNILRQSACVIATGRAALEAMACGVPVVICDHRSTYQGPLLDIDGLFYSMRRNYSGRGGIVPTVKNVREEIEAAMATETTRSHILEHHDVSSIVDELLKLA